MTDQARAAMPLTVTELEAQRAVAEMASKAAPLDLHRMRLHVVYANDVLRLLATIEAGQRETKELKDEYRKLELLWKEACVAREDYKMQTDAKDALWVGAYERAEKAESELKSHFLAFSTQTDALKKVEGELAEARKALAKCANRFREYERLHPAKNTLDGGAKANTNAAMALMCEKVLAIPPAPEAKEGM